MAVKFLDLTGLQKFWTKCKGAFVAKDTSGHVTITGALSVGDVRIENKEMTGLGSISVTGDITASSGMTSQGHVEVKEGSYVKLYNDDDTKQTYIGCSGDGKLVTNGGVVATEAYVTSAVANAGHLKREKVDALPNVSLAKENVIYMVSNNTAGNNKFDEYMLIDGAFEKTGSSDVDLSGYYTSTQTDLEITKAIANAHTAITEAEINGLV